MCLRVALVGALALGVLEQVARGARLQAGLVAEGALEVLAKHLRLALARAVALRADDEAPAAAGLAVGAVGRVALQLSPIAYGSAVHLDEWTAALRLASTECWFGEPCWVDATK